MKSSCYVIGTIVLAASAALAQPNIHPTPAPIQQYVTAGLGGVTLGSQVIEDSSSPTQFVTPALGQCGTGFALASASSGSPFPLASGAGTIQTAIADNAITAGHILIASVNTAGRVFDATTTMRSGVATGTCIVGVALTGSAAAGQAVTVLFDGPASYGTGSIVATGILSANGAGIAPTGNSVTGNCGLFTGANNTYSCVVTFNPVSGTVPTLGQATLNLTVSGGVGTACNIAYTPTYTAGTGYTQNPSMASVTACTPTGLTNIPTLVVSTTLTPGCVHMQDGAGNDMGLCAPSNGNNVLWSLPNGQGNVGQVPYLSAASSGSGPTYVPAALSWTTAPWLGTGLSIGTFGGGCGGGLTANSSSVGLVTLTGGPNVGCSFTLTFPLPHATHGWSCTANDQTTVGNLWQQTGNTNATATFSGNNGGLANDQINFICMPY